MSDEHHRCPLNVIDVAGTTSTSRQRRRLNVVDDVTGTSSTTSQERHRRRRGTSSTTSQERHRRRRRNVIDDVAGTSSTTSQERRRRRRDNDVAAERRLLTSEFSMLDVLEKTTAPASPWRLLLGHTSTGHGDHGGRSGRPP